MKCFSLLILLISLVGKLDSQTAEEILWKTQGAYRSLTNYVDEDRSILYPSFYYPSKETSTDIPDTFWYSMALDAKQNINFWYQRQSEDEIMIGSYIKSEKEVKGLLHDGFFNRPDITCSIAEAAARLTGRGHGRLYLVGSLMYPDFNPESSRDSSVILYYDSATKLEDTTINENQCFVILTKKTIIITQEFADKQNFKRDSIEGLLDLPPELRGGPRTEAGLKTTARKYYIRKNDFIILKVENISLQGDTDIVKSKTIVNYNPRLNVKDFKKYLEE